MAGLDSPLVFVTVGTDHHRFDRLMDWVDTWAARERGAHLVVQHGTAHPVAGAENVPFLPPERFGQLLDRATAVVCSAGPGAIMETRAAGRRPIVVPRRERLDEVVDDHQVTFARFLAARDLVTIAEDPETLATAIDHALDRPDEFEIVHSDADAPGIARVASLIDELVWGSR